MIPSEIIRDNSRLAAFDLTGFQKHNAKEIRWPELLSCVKALRSQYKRVGVLGYCYGGWSSGIQKPFSTFGRLHLGSASYIVNQGRD